MRGHHLAILERPAPWLRKPIARPLREQEQCSAVEFCDAFRIERLLAKVEAELAPPPSRWLGRLVVKIHEGDDVAETEARLKEAQEKALAEHIAAHPEHAGSTVKDFFWFVLEIVRVKRREDGTTVLSEPLTNSTM
jgi:hypothetical protein